RAVREEGRDAGHARRLRLRLGRAGLLPLGGDALPVHRADEPDPGRADPPRAQHAALAARHADAPPRGRADRGPGARRRTFAPLSPSPFWGTTERASAPKKR